MPRLTGTASPIQIGTEGYTLRAPGLVGEVRAMSAVENSTRGDGGLKEPALQAAIRQAGMVPGAVFEFAIESETPAVKPDGTRAEGLTATTREGAPALELAVPHLQRGAAYAVLYTDEADVSRWIMPENPPDAAVAAGAPVVFNLPRQSAPTPPPAGDGTQTRGAGTKLGRRLVRVVAWAGAPLLGPAVRAAAQAWEEVKRPYGLHRVTPDGYSADPVFAQPAAWSELGAGRALLQLHGSYSSSEASFAALGREALGTLASRYPAGVFAFNHPSLHHAPQENVQFFLDQLPPDVSLDLDVMTHSRGGLVGRELVRRLGELRGQGRAVQVRRALLVASPNQGTILTDPQNGIDLLDRYTNLLTDLPDSVYTYVLEGLLAVVKLTAFIALAELPGLNCLPPNNPYLQGLNDAAVATNGGAEFYAISADFTPDAPGLLARLGKLAGDKFIDSVFGSANDVVVPTLGGYAAGAHTGGFPLDEAHHAIFSGAARVHHSNYFSTPVVRAQILEWLTGA